MRRVDLQMDWLSIDAFVVASDARGLILNLSLHVCKVLKSPAGNVVEFGPFILL